MKKTKSILASYFRFILLFIPLLFLSFSAGDNKSHYNIPLAAWSVTAGDIDMDGDNDIVVGHNSNIHGVTVLYNTGYGYLQLIDTLFIDNGFPSVNFDHFDDNSFIDIYGGHVTTNPYNFYIGIIFNFGINGFDSINSYLISTNESIHYFTSGDINNDNLRDIVFASHLGQFWGVIYNSNFGNFSTPEYHYVNDYYPSEIACGDLNADNCEDIVVCGQNTEVYFSYPEGFQSIILETYNFKEGVSIEDFDLDGDNDILTFVGISVANVTSLIMYENHGNNLFDTIDEFYFQPMSDRFFVTDFDNDNLQDILFQLSNKTGFIIYYNQGNFQLGDSQFVALPPSNPEEAWRDCCSADIDGNSYTDIITVKTLNVLLPDNLSILFNDGMGNFLEEPLTNIDFQNNNTEISMHCYPNPFVTDITFEINERASNNSELYIYSIQGNFITCLTNNTKEGGQNIIKWDGFDTVGKPCKPGPLVAYLKVNGKVRQSIKLIKLN